MNSVSRRKWNLICSFKDNFLKHQGGGGQFRWEEKTVKRVLERRMSKAHGEDSNVRLDWRKEHCGG